MCSYFLSFSVPVLSYPLPDPFHVFSPNCALKKTKGVEVRIKCTHNVRMLQIFSFIYGSQTTLTMQRVLLRKGCIWLEKICCIFLCY